MAESTGRFIAGVIMDAALYADEPGLAKYIQYFVNLSKYEMYRAEVDAILIKNDFIACIYVAPEPIEPTEPTEIV